MEPMIDRGGKTVGFEISVVLSARSRKLDAGLNSVAWCAVILPDQHLKAEGMAEHMDAQHGNRHRGSSGRNYSPSKNTKLLHSGAADWTPAGDLADEPRAIWCKLYGLTEFEDLFTQRQLVALTTARSCK
jgi:putative DNA methylase